jgi:hypothetical protein
VQDANVGASRHGRATAAPQCEVLFELFQGDAGTVHLGRLLKGNDAGRNELLTLGVPARTSDSRTEEFSVVPAFESARALPPKIAFAPFTRE